LLAQQGANAQGKQVFDLVCAMCHSVAPPAKAAPPMSHVAGFYLQQHKTPQGAAAAIAAWAKNPQADKSLLPPMAVQRFGVMPSQGHLPDEQLAAVARYVVTLADTAHARDMKGMHAMPGMKHDMSGMKHDSTMRHDTTTVRR
jgi:mono/diheme cytochrome c family protein